MTKSQPEHTPGPWVAFYKHKYQEWHVSVPTASGGMLLGLFPDGVPTENPEGDARLIAAAPDLLAALEAAHERFCTPPLQEMYGDTALYGQISAAIAKAREASDAA